MPVNIPRGHTCHDQPADGIAARVPYPLRLQLAQQSYLLVTEDDFAKAAGVKPTMANLEAGTTC